MDYRGEILAELRNSLEEADDLRAALAKAKRTVVNLSDRLAKVESRMEKTVEEGAALHMSINGLSNASGFSRTKIRRIGGEWLA